MQQKWLVLFTTLTLLSFLIAPVGSARAQEAAPGCPPYEPGLLTEKEFLRSLPVECIREFKETARPGSASAAQEGDAQAKTTGGPDGFGYTYDDAVTYSWITATTNSGLTGDDEVAGPINLGFPFPFYGVPQSQLYFSTNGLISFGAGHWEWSGAAIPYETNPNHIIAPAWDDLLVGAPYNSGAIYYSQGGIAPNRYFVIEWRDVETSYSSPVFSFEAILHENGDIVFQYKSVPSPFWPIVGIEDSLGYNGLEYPYWSVSALKAIRFDYPAPAARFQVSPERLGGFVSPNGYKDYSVTITNTGAPGADTFDISLSSTWPAALYAANGVTLLTDTDADTLIDTGPLQPGASRTVIARFTTPVNAQVGARNSGLLGITSSLNPSPSIKRWVTLATSIPASFVNVFQDNADGAMSFATISPYEMKTLKATSDDYFGYNPAVIPLTNGNYLYFWAKNYYNDTTGWRDLEYAIVNRNGNILLPAAKLTNNAGLANDPSDLFPSVALAPDGTIGVVWTRRLNNYATSEYNYNIYFATLDGSGNLLTGPTNLTNNSAWGTNSTANVPRFFSPTIAASSDNRFVIGWGNEQKSMSGWVYDVWYAVRSTAGTSVFPPTNLTSNTISWRPILNSLTGGKVIMTWIGAIGGPYYAVLNSNGTVSKTATSLVSGADYYDSADAVQLPNGNVAVAWGMEGGVQFAILNSSYTRIYGPTSAVNPFPAYPAPIAGEYLSVTTDSSSHVIMTWAALDHVLLYALGSDTGQFLTEPMLYKTSGYYVDVSLNGQGNAWYEAGDPIEVKVGGVVRGSYGLLPSESLRVSFAGVNNGPVSIESKNAVPALAAERIIYKFNGVATSFTEMMGLPNGQLDNTYWLPWYNNVDLDTQLRIGNVSGTSATVHIFIGPSEVTPVEGITLPAGGSTRLSYLGVNNGPVQIVSNVNIVAAERLIYKVAGKNTSFSEMMALPNSQLDTTYWLPWYNNVDLDTQLRFANVHDTETAQVHVYIGGVEMPNSPFTLLPGESTRQSFTGVNNGPVQIVSNVNIVAAERLIYKVGGKNTSFTEMMALPNSKLDTTYWLPWYNNVDLDTQLRFANVHDTQTATVHVYIGGTEVPNSPFTLLPGESTRQSFTGVNNGPVQIVSNVNIVAAERLIYKVAGVNTSFSEMMALPNTQLDTVYWLPWYNNVDLDTQLRFGVP